MSIHHDESIQFAIISNCPFLIWTNRLDNWTKKRWKLAFNFRLSLEIHKFSIPWIKWFLWILWYFFCKWKFHSHFNWVVYKSLTSWRIRILNGNRPFQYFYGELISLKNKLSSNKFERLRKYMPRRIYNIFEWDHFSIWCVWKR